MLNNQQAMTTSHVPRDIFIFIVLQSMHLVKGSLKMINMNYGLDYRFPTLSRFVVRFGKSSAQLPSSL